MVRATDIAETRSRSWCQRKETDERIPAILQRSGRRRGMSSLGSIRSVYAVEDLPILWTISCRSGRVENHWMTGTCRASAGHSDGWDYATESPSRKKARPRSDSGAGLRLKWSIETKKGIVSLSYGRAFSLYQITIWRSIKLFRYDYHN